MARGLAGIVVLGLLVVGSPEAPAGPTESPNIIFILLDDAGYRDFGAMGNGYIQTPSIDAFAQEGTTLTQFYATALCVPTRTGLLTGHDAARFGVRRTGPGFFTAGGTVTLPQMLNAEGYTTGHVGKWYLKSVVEDYIPLSAGFDRDVRFRSRLANTSSYFDPFITIDDAEVVHHVGEHLTAVLTDYAIEFIEENAASGPFFLQLWHWAPHSPIEPPLEWAALYPNTPQGRFAALLSDADEEIGRLLDALDALGIADNTVVFITSDNGGVSTSHGGDPASGPSHGELRGFKGQMYEGGIRLPLFARWPGMIAPDSTNDSVAACVDFFPTAMELAGADTSSLGLSGKSLVDILLGATESREALFWELKAQHEFYESPDDIFDDFAVRQDDWKLVREDDQVMLFDLATDIGEQSDVAAANPAIVSDLLAQQSAWRLAEGLIAHDIDVTQGDVVVEEDVITFGGGNGVVTFAENEFYDVQTHDFSFLVSITPEPTPLTMQLLARKESSWELWRTPNGRIRLIVHGTQGSRTVLFGNTKTQPGQRHDIAFTVFGWKSGDSTVRLYVDGVLEGESTAIPAVKSGAAPPTLGLVISPSPPFAGTMENLGFYSVALRPLEIDALFAQ